MQMLYISAQAPLLALSLIEWELLIPSAALAASYALLSRRRVRNRDQGLLSFSSELHKLNLKKGLNSSLRDACKLNSAPHEIRVLSLRSQLGEFWQDSNQSPGDHNIRELSGIVSFGINSGADISGHLKAFVSNLEGRIESRNRMLQNSLNMETLSRIGVAFFVPLFGGIGTSIIGASGVILNSNTAHLRQSFEITVVAYIAVMGYLMNVFGAEGKDANPVINSLQLAAIGAAIMNFSASMIANAL